MTYFNMPIFGKTKRLLAMGLTVSFLLASCGGSGSSAPPPTPPPPTPPPAQNSDVFSTEAKTSRFLGKATFGATQRDISSLTGGEVSDWIRAEFTKVPTNYLPDILAEINALPETEDVPPRRISDLFFDAAIAGDDQLRQRMVLALSEIIVVSNAGQLDSLPRSMADYMDVLSDNAFGNYRDLLEDVTYTPAMAFYLTYLANQKGDPESGRVPDENYARELLQLFTIGLVELNLDGTVRLDGQGEPIEIFDNSDITGLAKVFTGLSVEGSDFFFFFRDRSKLYEPLEAFPQYHSNLEKSFLGITIPPNTNAEQSIDMALDEIFNHSNMAPFLSRQLIQRFTSSNPSPAYVQRVATAFEMGRFTLPDGSALGTGQRGDLQATIAAVLLDADALLDPSLVPSEIGKIREPILRLTNWARGFNETTPDARDEEILSSMQSLGQHPFRSPSVFNFYRPGYIAPGTETGDAGLTAPELQITNESSSMAYINFINAFIYNFSPNISGDEDGGVKGDYSAQLAIADDGQVLIDRLDLLLTGNSLAPETRSRLLAMMDEIPIQAASEETDRLSRVLVATTMVMTSPGYLVQR